MNTIYQNNNVKNNNQQIYQKGNEIHNNKTIPFRKKVKIKLNDSETSTIIIGQTDRSYVTYDGHVIPKNKVINIIEL